MLEKGKRQGGAPTDPGHAFAQGGGDLLKVLRALVREFPALDVAPQLFRRIEFRRVPGQTFHREPRVLGAEKRGGRAFLDKESGGVN